ncbi:Alpha-1,3-mannosyltransferase-like protein [Saitoella coloradoensis]
MKIAFVHPDLGIGGAERLVIDAAVGLQNRGHQVVIYTSHCDKSHCFEEARDGTLDVRVRGNTLPPNFLGRFAILFAILRQLHLTITLLLESTTYDTIFVDQLSTSIPLLRFKAPVFFYCHFPDKYLAQPGGLLKKLYRLPFDAVEEYTTASSDAIVVNSNFTRSVFAKAFPRIKRTPGILYPCVDITPEPTTPPSSRRTLQFPERTKVILSINRFERKKNIELALKAFATLRAHPNFQNLRLVLAGGYDSRVTENVTYHHDLQSLASSMSLTHQTVKPTSSLDLDLDLDLDPNVHVLFLLSIPGPLKDELLRTSTLLAYTPTNEHFGIVPLEAGLASLPVLATNTGGPLETIVDGATGWLRPADAEAWGEVMRAVIEMEEGERERMGRAARERVVRRFSLETMAGDLEDGILSMLKETKTNGGVLVVGVLLAVLLVTLVVCLPRIA